MSVKLSTFGGGRHLSRVSQKVLHLTYRLVMGFEMQFWQVYDCSLVRCDLVA